MRTKEPPYVCPKCGYSSEKKETMNRHFQRKTPCPSINPIDLSDEIKQFVLDHRIYHPPKVSKKSPQQPTINQQINNIQYVQNFISSLDPLEKLKTYCEYKDIKPINFEDALNDRYSRVVERLEANKYKYGYRLSSNDFLDIINDTCSLNGNIENFNVFYDEKANKLRLYLDDWNEYFMDMGIEKLIFYVKEYYLDYYEDYAYRQIVNPELSLHERKQYEECLDEYYKYLITFNIKPKNDDEGFERYERLKATMSTAEKKEVYKRIVGIVKTNSRVNVGSLNCKIVSLFHMDETFKTALLNKMVGPPL